MTFASFLRHGPLALAAALLVPAAAAPGAQAAGFAAPAVITGKDEPEDTQAAIAPGGETAVLYTRTIQMSRRTREQLRLVTGASPSQLGAPTTLRIAGIAAGRYAPRTQLHARPGGGFVLCLQSTKAFGCSFAAPQGSFGPLIRLSAPSTNSTTAVRPDGSVVALFSKGRGGRDLAVTTLSPGGVASPLQTIKRSRTEYQFNPNLPELAVTGDGTIAIQANLASGRRNTQLGIRLMAPGAPTFGPVVPIPGAITNNNISLTSGPALTVSYFVETAQNDYPGELRVVRRAADGSFSQVLGLPSTATSLPGRNPVTDAALLGLPTGELLALTGTTTIGEYDQDCLNPVGGEVAVGGLAPPGTPNPASPLSTAGQIALDPQAVALADGTVIASWANGANEGGDQRLEAAVRAPGRTTFGRGQRLPRLAQTLTAGQEPHLVAGGNQAALLWTVLQPGSDRYVDSRRSTVLSAFSTAGPYAKQARLPRHPVTPCD